MSHDRIDPDLRVLLDRLGRDEKADVLVYAAGAVDDLVAYLAARQEAGELRFTVLGLAECVVVRAERAVIDQVAGRGDVQVVIAHPAFGADGALPAPRGESC
jgi:hypothetical protein